ncbi:MAG TPA: sugar phosphate isomerase/epimerase [Gaiellaceae bacterium]|nr:sugar phosphate isomerase/epimerase [Gaiellaceae bacterium]
MRLAGHTYAFRRRPLEEALDALSALGLSRVEVWLGHGADGPAAVAEALGRRGLCAAAVSAGGFYRADSDVPARAGALAEGIGAPVVVMCVAPALLAGVPARMPSSVAICVENHWDQPLASPREVGAALRGFPELAACLDTGHALLAGVRPERFVGDLAGRVGHVHMKEARVPSLAVRALGRRARRRLLAKPAPVVPGEGDLNVPRLRDALATAAFEGTITVEHEGDDPEGALRRLLDEWASAEV